MAYESKSVQVSVSAENDTIEVWEAFGWQLKSSQEVFNQSNHLETRDGDLYNVTTTTNYVKLTFTRDTEMKNYSKLVELERKYYNVSVPYTKSSGNEPKGWDIVLMFLPWLFFIPFLINTYSCMCGSGKEIIPFNLTLIFVGVGVVILAIFGLILKNREENAEYENKKRENAAKYEEMARKNEILAEAKKLH